MKMVCPHCDVLAHFTRVWSDYLSDADDPFGPISREGILDRLCWVCDNCYHPVCGVHRTESGFTDLFVWPETVAYRSYDDVPEAIASTASEAHQSLGAKARRAAVAMARATVEATAKNKGITRGNLQAKIEQLHANGLIGEDMMEAAHEVRFAGNEVAHGDILNEPISLEDAKEIVQLMDAILERVYQEPAKVARVRANRLARHNAQAPAQAEGSAPHG
jgi:hypothetical protein